jgi:hypothetical protein
VPVEHFQQFYQRQGRFGLAIFIARKGITYQYPASFWWRTATISAVCPSKWYSTM